MGAPSYCYTCAGGGQILENWGKWSQNSIVVSWLRLETTTDYIPCPFRMYTQCLAPLYTVNGRPGTPSHCYTTCASVGQILEIGVQWS